MSAWLLSADLRSLTKLKVSTSGADAVGVRGKRYGLGSAVAPEEVSYSGIVNLADGTLSLDGGALQFTRSETLQAGARLTDVVGAWRQSVGGGVVNLNWTVAADGALSATSTTGCTYQGRMTARDAASVLDVTLTEICADIAFGFQGIATYRLAQPSTPAALTLALVSDDAQASRALAVLLTR